MLVYPSGFPCPARPCGSSPTVCASIGGALADYFNGGAYGGFVAEDFEWDENDFDLNLR